jgi:hypothetical protein
MSAQDAFFMRLGPGDAGDRFQPTELARGPWSADALHAGPPAALVGRAIERLPGAENTRLARFVFDILRPIPLAPLEVVTRVIHDGRRVRYTEAMLRADGADEGKPIARAAAWQIRIASDGVANVGLSDPVPFSGPDDSAEQPLYEPGWSPSYFDAMEFRFANGSMFELGPAACWMRSRVPLVEGEDTSAPARLLVAADSGNGISAALPLRDHLFANIDLTVHLARDPFGEWVCVDAVTRISPDGIGYTETVLWDRHGRIGAANQTLLVARR